MKGLGALQRHQLPHPLTKILDPPLCSSLLASSNLISDSSCDCTLGLLATEAMGKCDFGAFFRGLNNQVISTFNSWLAVFSF